MPRIPTSLFSGSILVILLCQTIVRQLNFPQSASAVNLLLTFSLLICAAAGLSVGLETRPRCKPVEEQIKPAKKPAKKGRHDTI